MVKGISHTLPRIGQLTIMILDTHRFAGSDAQLKILDWEKYQHLFQNQIFNAMLTTHSLHRLIRAKF